MQGNGLKYLNSDNKSTSTKSSSTESLLSCLDLLDSPNKSESLIKMDSQRIEKAEDINESEFIETNEEKKIYKCIFCLEEYINPEEHIDHCELFYKHSIKDRKYFFTNHCITEFENYKYFVYIPSKPIDIPIGRSRNNSLQ